MCSAISPYTAQSIIVLYISMYAEFDFDSDSAHRVALIVNKDGQFEFILPPEFLDSTLTAEVHSHCYRTTVCDCIITGPKIYVPTYARYLYIYTYHFLLKCALNEPFC